MDLDVKLKPVTRSDIRFLYNQLKERDPTINISHKKIPSYTEHSKFVLSRPYSKWYIVFYKNTKMNEIGIFILKSIKIKGIGTIILEKLLKMNPRTRYLANVNPRNTKSSSFFKKNGFKLIQHTYELTLN